MNDRAVQPSTLTRRPEAIALPRTGAPKTAPTDNFSGTSAARGGPQLTTPAQLNRAAPTNAASNLGWSETPKPGVLDSLRVKLQTPATSDAGAAELPTSIAGVKVASARVLRFDGLAGSAELMKTTVEVKFGRLSPQQFNALKAEFGGLSAVPYSADREYSAIDFLPPHAQALVNKDPDFPAAVTLSGTSALREAPPDGEVKDFEISLYTNCHGTAFELARAFQGTASKDEFSVFYGDATMMGDLVADEAAFATIGRANPGQAKDFIKDLKPGDVISFYQHDAEFGDSALLHSAVYAGGGLFLEKPDSEMDEYQETPYRLVSASEILAPIEEHAGADSVSMVARRPTRPLPTPEAVFGSADEPALKDWAAKKGQTLGASLVVEMEMGMGGAVRGIHATAMDKLRLGTGADGRAVATP